MKLLKNMDSNIIKNKFLDIVKTEKYRKVIVVLGLIGIFLIFISNLSKNNEKVQFVKETNSNSEEYTYKLEKNLEIIVSSIKGAGKTKVLVTLANAAETVYATEEKNNKEDSEDTSNGEVTRKKQSNDLEKKFITIKDSDGTEKALAVTEIQPIIKGVIVVCQGGNNPTVQKSIIEALTTVLNITSKQVYVTKSA